MRAKRFCLVLLIAGSLAAACAASSATTGDYANPNGGDVTTQGTGDGGNGHVGAGPTQAPGSKPGANASGAPAASSGTGAPEDQIVKTGTISIQVAAVDDAVARATDQIHNLGGWLAGSDRTSDSAQATASVTYRVPVAQFENALAAMRKFGSKVLGEHTESTPVGGQIVDLNARIANLKASEKAIQAIMDKATSINDVLTIQQRLADVQGQIEELSGQVAGLTDTAAFSTLTVDFVVPYTPTESATPSESPSPTPVPWSAADQAGQAAGTLQQVGEGGATVFIWIAIVFVPVAVALVVLLILLGFAARVLDPYRRRLLPFTVARPVTFTPPMPYGAPRYPTAPVAPRPEDGPKT